MRRIASYDPIQETLWVGVRRGKSSRSVVMAEPESTTLQDKDHPELVGTVNPAQSRVMVLADYNTKGELVGIEVIGVPDQAPS